MARKVFFSFHFQRDSWRVSQVRNSGIISKDSQTPFLDKAQWEQVQRSGNTAIKRWIDNQLIGTSVTVVLIGYETVTRPWVLYEIKESWNKQNGLIGVYIHNIKDHFGQKDYKGRDPFSYFGLEGIRTYDWVNDLGRYKLSEWIEEAYERAKLRDLSVKLEYDHPINLY